MLTLTFQVLEAINLDIKTTVTSMKRIAGCIVVLLSSTAKLIYQSNNYADRLGWGRTQSHQPYGRLWFDCRTLQSEKCPNHSNGQQ